MNQSMNNLFLFSLLSVIGSYILVSDSYDLEIGFNLIAVLMGINDGLVAIIWISSFYGLKFYAAGLNFYFLLSLGLIGILSYYLMSILLSTKKILMVDKGSLTIGFYLGFLSLEPQYLESIIFKPKTNSLT